MRLANFFSVVYQIFTIVVRQIKRTSQFCQMFWSFPFCLFVWHKRLYDIDNWAGQVIFGTGYIQEGEEGSNQRKVILSNPILALSQITPDQNTITIILIRMIPFLQSLKPCKSLINPWWVDDAALFELAGRHVSIYRQKKVTKKYNTLSKHSQDRVRPEYWVSMPK